MLESQHTASAEAALARLASRYSVGARHLDPPGPSTAELVRMAEIALRAPDHAELVPFRFKVVRGEARQRLAALFERAALDAGKEAPAAAMDAQRAAAAPVTVALVARIDLGHPIVPAHEQWACVGGALANFLNAAHLLGYAGKMLSGAKVRDPNVAAAFCAPGETLVGWIVLGTPRHAPSSGLSRKPQAAQIVSEWPGSPSS